MNTISNLKDMTKDDILEMLGLQFRKSAAEYIAPALGVFGAGILVGVGVGLLVAPKSGRQLREDITNKVSRISERGVGEEAAAH